MYSCISETRSLEISGEVLVDSIQGSCSHRLGNMGRELSLKSNPKLYENMGFRTINTLLTG